MNLKPFKLERYFAQHEFSARFLLSSSDCDGLAMSELLSLANDEEQLAWDKLRLGYTESQGFPALRSAIAAQYQSISANNVVIASPGEINYALMVTQLKVGDHMVCMRPAYQSLYEIAVSLGCNVSYWEPDENMRYNVDALESLVTRSTKIIAINFPHNPTGFAPGPDECKRIVAIARKNNALLFSDEMYFELTHSGELRIPSFADLYENAIALWGMSKSFGLAGLRIGWAVSQNVQLLQDILMLKDYLSICSAAPSEILSFIALRNKKLIIEKNIVKIKKNMGLFETFSKEFEDLIEFRQPVAGSTAFVRLKVPNTLTFCNDLVEKAGVMLLPSEMFDVGSGHVRIGFGRENFHEALTALKHYLRP